MEKLYTSTKTRSGADCGSDHELLITKFGLKLKEVGKTARPFSYDLNKIPYDYTVEVRNIFKGLDLLDRVPDELWSEVRDIVQETRIKTIPIEKKCKKAKWLSGEALQLAVTRRKVKSKGEKEMKKAKWLSEEALQIAVKRRQARSKGEKERYTQLNAEFQRIARREESPLQ